MSSSQAPSQIRTAAATPKPPSTASTLPSPGYTENEPR
ncbi:hypothetical protein MLGJGCBP_02966 [Rhodococcus sp. T7]|nr:hypothetical protein MLGJGCBP_09414 [Rhodococcus sp. T7]KAF0963892.1 hypothetical protein MLGJGCBP_02966 [Rhodococcus sp. T7]